MESDFLQRLRQEEADLAQKLEAVRMVLRAYGHSQQAAAPSPKSVSEDTAAHATPKPQRQVATSDQGKVHLDRFGDYGRAVVRTAIAECQNHPDGPISTRDMVRLVERSGIQVRGNDKVNAVSALLARSIDLKPNGRKGWTLSDERLARRNAADESDQESLEDMIGGVPPLNENEPRSGNAGGSDVVSEGGRTLELTEVQSVRGTPA